jgi:hypothetical protein
VAASASASDASWSAWTIEWGGTRVRG